MVIAVILVCHMHALLFCYIIQNKDNRITKPLQNLNTQQSTPWSENDLKYIASFCIYFILFYFMLSWKGPIRIIKSNFWPCAGHPKGALCLRALSQLLKSGRLGAVTTPLGNLCCMREICI